MSALSSLVAMGLVVRENDFLIGDVLVAPASDPAEKATCEWAESWCVNDGSCGVEK